VRLSIGSAIASAPSCGHKTEARLVPYNPTMKTTAAIFIALVTALVATSGAGAGSSLTVSPGTKLALTVGPGFTITLTTATGKSFTSLKKGTYTIVVKDKASIHNAHLTAPGGISKKTGVSFTGTVTWKVKFAKTGTLKFQCDPHSFSMHGSKKIV
jgi:plastocyanin